MAVDVGEEIQRNLLIGSGKNIQGRFVIGYAKLSHKPSDIDFEIAPALASEVNLRTRLSAIAESTKLDSEAIFDMPIFIITGMGKMRFSDAEQSNLKTYLSEKGGFLMVDARDSDFQQSIRTELRKLFPDKPLQDITSVGQLTENWYQINGRRFDADVLKLDGRVAVFIRNMPWDFRPPDIHNPTVQFYVNAVTYAITNSPMVERHEYTPVTLMAHKIDDGIEVKAIVISHKIDSGVLTLTLVHPDGRVISEQQQDLNVSSEKASEYKTIFPKQDNIGKYRLKYSWRTNQCQYVGNVSMGELIGELDTRVFGQTQWHAGSPASLRVIALNHAEQLPIAGAQVNAQVVMKETKKVVANFSGKTDDRGTAEIRFKAPEDLEGSAELQVKVDSSIGTDNVKQEISIVKTHKILLSTDKPLYQPGQTIHIRSLALNATTLKPIGNSNSPLEKGVRGLSSPLPKGARGLSLEVEDSKGNKVFKYIADTDKFGIAAADFNLADEINMGPYTIRAILGEVTQEKKVTVDRYVLPKFKINFSTDKDFYLPAETLKGELQADYFFGKPVAGGKVTIKASKFDVGFDEFAQIEGKTNANGHYTFEINLPSHFVGQPLEQGNTFVMFDISVVDGAEHEEKITQNRSVVKSPITIVIIPESGDIVPNVENIIYVMTTYPDGKPAQTTVELESRESELKSQTDSLGVATFRVKPQTNALSIKVTAVDKQGNRAERSQNFQAEAENTLLLRTDEALYKVGDVIHAEVFSVRQSGSVYLDLIKSKQTILTKSVEMKDGRGSVDIHLSESDFGTLELHAYQITQGSNIIRDTRVVYVDSADDLNIGITASKPVYLPGEEAKLDFSVTNPEGHPVLAALGIQVVDESVFALQEMQPGLEKVYFMLEKELLKPKYEIHGYTMDSIVMEPIGLRERRQTAAKVLMASVEQIRDEYSLNLRTYEQKEQQYKNELQAKVAARADAIAEAIKKYFEKTKRPIESQNPLQSLVDEGFLKSADIIDPWGAAFIFTQEGLHSVGPDGLLNTDDDITVWRDMFAGGLGWMVEKERGVDVLRFLGRGARGIQFKAARAVNGRAEFLMAREAPEAAPMIVASTVAGAKVVGHAVEEAPRIRQYFPETLFVTPALITDEKGKATLGIPMADSITTWRLTSMASSLNGQLGSATAGIRVFQDFFIDIDLPVSLTQNDEVSIPIAIYNYLPSEQNIRLKLTQEPWFELIEDSAERQITLQKDQVSVMYYRLKVKEIGWHKLTMHAYGDKMSDAISRQIEVIPDGKQFLIAQSDRLESDVERKIEIPVAAIDGASKVLVKVYPGVFSQVMEGLENILQMPFGCFEQTSSTTYPNILAMDYMKATKQTTPEIQMKAEEYINLGYQRLLSYEVQGGGFSWFGDAPANQVLTAYGLMEFHDMAQVHEVDPKVIERTQNWLISRQQADGSWEPDKVYLHQESWGRIQNSKLLPTAYIIWALLESVGDNPLAPFIKGDESANSFQQNINRGVGYIRTHLKEADDAYTLAIIANALVLADKNDASTNEVMEKLKNMAIEDKDTAHWESKISTITHSHGDSADIEATAMAAQALLKYGKYSALTNKVLTYLIRQKDSNGTWHGTQATILALKALLMSIGNMTEEVDATVRILINGAEAERLRITPENSDVMRLVDLGQQTIEGFNNVQLKLEGKGSLMYQIVGKFYLPWEAGEKPEIEPLSIDVIYDKRELEKDDMVTCKVTVVNNKPATANMVLVDLGIPPGFEVQTDGLTELVENGTIKKFNLTNRQIIIYFDKLIPKQPVELKYRIRAKFPIKAKTRVSRVYEYYNPEVESFAEPVELVVTE
jgi:uncharacterized protein YfaS (alpha-2-macroglobulin family)